LIKSVLNHIPGPHINSDHAAMNCASKGQIPGEDEFPVITIAHKPQ